MEKAKRNVILIFTLFFLTLLLLIVFWEPILGCWLDYSYNRREARLALPQNGTYKCSEAGITISFSEEEGILMKNEAGQINRLCFDYNGFFIGEQIHRFSEFHWNSRKDILYLRITKSCWGMQEGVRYRFSRVPE